MSFLRLLAFSCGLAVVCLAPVATAAAKGDDARYALANKCYALHATGADAFVAKAPGGGYTASTGGAGAAEAIRMKASGLGTYLLYGKAGDFIATGAADTVETATDPGPATDWKVDGPASGFTISTVADGRVLTVTPGTGTLTLAPKGTAGNNALFTFAANQGCATFPEADVNATGKPTKGATGFGTVRGFFDSIDHMMAFEFIGGSIHCGRPWSPYGVTKALVDCPDHGPMGAGAALENALSYGGMKPFHDTVGWPTFKDWPAAKSLTHEQVYYKWLERSWRGGQRLMVDVGVDNAQLCEKYPLKRNPCDEMNTVRLQIADSYKLQDYIDAQSGGPGKGWFRIVKDPFQARRVMNDGKLAVVLGMETSRPFNCRYLNDVPQCSRAQIDSELNDLYARGLRSAQLVNKFDNPLVGVTGDAGPTGIVLNSGNKGETGHFWNFQTCPAGKKSSDDGGHDRNQVTAFPGGDEAAFARAYQALGVPVEAIPLYPPAPHCNTRGLTDLGKYAIRAEMAHHMIFDPDHMSVLGRDQSLALLESQHYSGVISTHGWSTPDSFPRIYGLGGLVTPSAGDSTYTVQQWQQDRKLDKNPHVPFAIGIGSDIEGLGSQGNPRGANAKNPVTYPFKSLDPAVTLNRSHSGQRTWDINTDGVAQYGLYPDWIEDLRKLAGDQIVNDMAKGAEAYVAMWERADGVPAERCQPARARVTAKGIGRAHLGDDPRALLMRAGQPVSRPGRPWDYCLQKRGGRPAGRLKPVFTQQGTLAFVASTGPEQQIANVGPGARASKLPHGTKAFGKGLRTLSAGAGKRFVFGLSKGKVRFVAVASKKAVASRKALRSYVALSGV